MALIRLQNIGKIYVSEGNVAVGIRGVNLSFHRGEFVAITGKSGSGKSTLLNVISGMDTYEEGELYVNGEATSHYLQKDWEEYRKKYISFIFQDYNIVESFTVLENVELALMHIDDRRERRRRAMELIRRVGLEGHIRHKGSQLSGGQKQRTVIARALAKDSPILLADEPTGNLDSQTSKEILALLREISHDKLVIIVTHNFDQVEEYATRHVRIFDGAVESDHILQNVEEKEETAPVDVYENLANKAGRALKNGTLLGWVRFKSKPKLSFFLTVLLCLAVLAASLVTALSGEAYALFEKRYMFTPMEGRTVIARKDGAVMTGEELKALASKVGAKEYWQNDYLLDYTLSKYFPDYGTFLEFVCEYDSELVPDVGRLPEKVNEVMLSLPIGMQPYFGKEELKEEAFSGAFIGIDYTVVGVHYFYDNTKPAKLIFTEEGYRFASFAAIYDSMRYSSGVSATLLVSESFSGGGSASHSLPFNMDSILVSFAMEPGTYGVLGTSFDDPMASFRENAEKDADYRYTVTGEMTGRYTEKGYEGYYDYPIYYADVEIGPGQDKLIRKSFEGFRYCDELPNDVQLSPSYDYGNSVLVVSPDLWVDFMENYNAVTYTQASLFFQDDEEAHGKIELLRDLGYVAVTSDSTVEADGYEMILAVLTSLFAAVSWLLAMVFIALFLNLCSGRAMMASSGDVAIMRSMGIPVRVIRISVYVQTLFSLLPAFLVSAAVFILIYLFPETNRFFMFLHAREYIFVALGVILIALLMSRRFVRKLFGNSVKKALKGEAEK